MLFLTKYWRVILIGLILCTTFYYKYRYEATAQAYSDYKLTQSVLYDAEVKKNAELGKLQTIAINDVVATHAKQLKDANLNRVRETNNLKGSINEIRDALTIADNAIKLRDSARYNTLPKDEKDTSKLTEAARNSNLSIKTIIDACLVTDYDYEALYNAWNEQCKLGLCE
jgi:hypothetical protein